MRSQSPVIAVVFFLLATTAHAQPVPQGPPQPGQAVAPRQAPRSAEVAPDGRVTFRLEAPGATAVLVNGDWPGGRGLAMSKDASGLWTLTTGPLAAEIWSYTYAIDGVTAIDPGNVRVVRDGARRLNTVAVPGAGSALYQVAKVPHGTVAAVWYPSPTQKTPRRMLIYTPPGYEGGNTAYPVLYLFHGGGGDEEAWNELGAASTILDNLIAQGKARPMIVVLPNANWHDSSVLETGGARTTSPAAAAARPGAAAMPVQDYTIAEQEIVNGIIPHVEAHYRVAPGRDQRAIAGLSMGGGITIAVGLKRLDLFSAVAQFSTGMFGGAGPAYGPFDVETIAPGFLKDAPATNAKLKVLYFSCGDDDPRMPFQKKVADTFRAAGVTLTFRNFAGAHEWRVWRASLADVAGLLFR